MKKISFGNRRNSHRRLERGRFGVAVVVDCRAIKPQSAVLGPVLRLAQSLRLECNGRSRGLRLRASDCPMSTGPLFCILVLFDRWATAYRDVDAPTSRAVVKGKLDRPSSEECRADASEHRTDRKSVV